MCRAALRRERGKIRKEKRKGYATFPVSVPDVVYGKFAFVST